MVPYHRGEDGLPPEAVKRLINDWHRLLRAHDVQFTVRDYSTIRPKQGDWIYLDPPYEAGNCRLYYGRFDHQRLFEWLGRQIAGYALSLNGFVGDEDRRLDVPKFLFDDHMLIENGTSAMFRLNGMASPRLRDSLYLRFECDDSKQQSRV